MRANIKKKKNLFSLIEKGTFSILYAKDNKYLQMIFESHPINQPFNLLSPGLFVC